MFAVALDTSNELAQALLIHYSFDLSGYSASELIARWQNQYPLSWLHLAIIEALYQGRYKAISVQQILALWLRRGQASFHFNVEFENLICSRFPEIFTVKPTTTSRLNKPKKNTNLPQQTYLSPVSVVTHNSQSSTTTHTQVDRGKEHTRKEDTEEIPGFLTLARRHRQPTLRNTDNHIDSDRDNFTYTESNSPSSQNSSSNYTNSPLLSAWATATAVETSDAVSPSLATQQLNYVETSKLNHPPIGQFTPENSDRSNSFTSKLKAISSHQAGDGED
ncbi:MAG: hypothetical protein QNJ51_00090 [Calothrix sp. MO_167.B12]|nr:hypothetical protein [Calothrix sp. MO_167.B12]